MQDETGPPDSGDSIEFGKRLVRAHGQGGLSLGERLANRFYRLTWRTPLHALRLRGRYPLKLLTVPDDPLTGDEGRGRLIIEGQFSFRKERLNVSGCNFSDPNLSQDFQNYLQSFAWLRDLATAGNRAETAPIAEGVTRLWLETYAETVTETAWRGDILGRRILHWASHSPLILSSTDIVYRSAVLNAFARGARHLDRIADRTPAGVTRVIAWSGIAASGLLMPGGEPRRAFGEAGLEKAIFGAFSGDGGTLCRTPQNLVDAIETLSMLQSVYDARRLSAPIILGQTLNSAVPALLGVTMGDGALGCWQGSGAILKSEVDAVIAASGVRARPLRHARDWGYQRMQAGQSILVMDAAPPPLSRVGQGGCASTLAFELSDGPHRLIVNCGGARVGGAHISPSLANGLRTTAAHSTLTLADSNSTAIHSDGSLGKGVSEVELDRKETEGGSRVEAGHDGYGRRFGLIHRRTLAMTPDGREVRCDDILMPTQTRRKRSTVPFAIRFHLGIKVEPSPTADGLGALLRISQGALWQFRCNGGSLSIDDSIWVDGEGCIHPTHQLIISGESPPGGAAVSWVLRRAG